MTGRPFQNEKVSLTTHNANSGSSPGTHYFLSAASALHSSTICSATHTACSSERLPPTHVFWPEVVKSMRKIRAGKCVRRILHLNLMNRCFKRTTKPTTRNAAVAFSLRNRRHRILPARRASFSPLSPRAQFVPFVSDDI